MANEKRLIDANALIADIAKAQDELITNNDALWQINQKYYKGLAWAHRLALDAPTVDAVEVVRCKECKHYVPERKHPWNEETGYDFTKVEILQFGECRGQNAIFTEDGSVNVHENDFCSNGERREGE